MVTRYLQIYLILTASLYEPQARPVYSHKHGQSVTTGSRECLPDETDGKQHNVTQAAPNELELGENG